LRAWFGSPAQGLDCAFSPKPGPRGLGLLVHVIKARPINCLLIHFENGQIIRCCSWVEPIGTEIDLSMVAFYDTYDNWMIYKKKV
jgi:hypothetical protein